MESNVYRKLILTDLKRGLPGLTSVVGSFMAEASIMCLEDQSHESGAELIVNGDYTSRYSLCWNYDITDQMYRSWKDKKEATEFGACGIAFLVILDLTDYTIVSRSSMDTGIDYWLGKEENEDDPPSYMSKARLEISGILKGSNNDIQARVKKKLKQVELSDDTNLPAYIVIVEFSRPLSMVVKK